VELKGLEEDIFNKEQKSGEFHLISNNTWGPPSEPHAYLGSMRLPSHADYQAQIGLPMKKQIDDTIGKILRSMDEKDRQERYRYVLTTLHEQAVYLPISYNGGFFVHGSGLTNVSYGPTKDEIPFVEIDKQ
jgi:nickel transport system substrate-binding protein